MLPRSLLSLAQPESPPGGSKDLEDVSMQSIDDLIDASSSCESQLCALYRVVLTMLFQP